MLDYDTRSVRPRIAKHTPDHGCSQKGSRSPQGQCHLMVAGAGFVPDSYSEKLPLVAVCWVYAPAQQGAREMRRIGLAA